MLRPRACRLDHTGARGTEQYRALRRVDQIQALSFLRVPEPGTEDDENGR